MLAHYCNQNTALGFPQVLSTYFCNPGKTTGCGLHAYTDEKQTCTLPGIWVWSLGVSNAINSRQSESMSRVLAIHSTCWPTASDMSKVVQGKNVSRNIPFEWYMLKGVQLNAKVRLHYEINVSFSNALKHSGPRIHSDIKNEMKERLAFFSRALNSRLADFLS